ncbi:MAG TPA: AI-2E family transporter [Burkholderiaceae bacterium]|nr:AI-2E family transporter [Burkholderiaceae bacterium]
MNALTTQRLQTGLWLGLALLVLALLYVLAPILTPFALAAILAYLLAPGTQWMTQHRIGRFGLPRWFAALAMIFLSTSVILLLLLILIPVLQNELLALQKAFPAMVNRLNDALSPKLREWFGLDVQLNTQSLRQLLSDQVSSGSMPSDVISEVLRHVRAGGAAVLGVVGTLALTPVVLFYLLVDWDAFKHRCEALIPRRWHRATTHALSEIDTLLAQFLRGQLLVMLVLAGYYCIALTIAGFNTALPVGILTGLLVFIPYVGFSLGLILALISGLLQFGPLYALVSVGVIYGVGQFAESFFLTPRLVGERLGLHPLTVIFALMAFGQIFGFFGVLAALPVSAALMVIVKRIKHAYLASEFYSRT